MRNICPSAADRSREPGSRIITTNRNPAGSFRFSALKILDSSETDTESRPLFLLTMIASVSGRSSAKAAAPRKAIIRGRTCWIRMTTASPLLVSEGETDLYRQRVHRRLASVLQVVVLELEGRKIGKVPPHANSRPIMPPVPLNDLVDRVAFRGVQIGKPRVRRHFLEFAGQLDEAGAGPVVILVTRLVADQIAFAQEFPVGILIHQVRVKHDLADSGQSRRRQRVVIDTGAKLETAQPVGPADEGQVEGLVVVIILHIQHQV